MRSYWEFIVPEVREGRTAAEILRNLPEPFAGWDNSERVAVNTAIVARGAGPRVPERVRMRLLGEMGALARSR
jgi:hypothetical protein